MHEMFNTELPMLKLNFYQLDRLIAILIPDLHMHLKEEQINSSFYSSPYFITLFTSVLQMQTTGDNCHLLMRLWDYFIIYGWKAIFKASIVLLKDFEDVLLGMPFEVMLTQIVNLPLKFLIINHKGEEKEAIEKFDNKMRSVNIPTMLLERLKREFDQNLKISGSI